MPLDDCNQSFKGLCYQKVLLFGVMEQLHLMLNLPLATKCIRCHTSQSSKGNCIHLPVLSHRPISRHIKPCVMHGQCEDRPTVTFPAKKTLHFHSPVFISHFTETSRLSWPKWLMYLCHLISNMGSMYINDESNVIYTKPNWQWWRVEPSQL